MEKKFILPASTLITGIIVWVIFLIVYTSDNIMQMTEVIIGIITGGIILFSAFTCRRAGGPRSANIFRASVLFVMAVLSFWLIGIIAAILILVASIGIVFIILRKQEPVKEAVG